MAKTAEEILAGCIFMEDFVPEGSKTPVILAMEEFAAQEVEAYRERLKAEVRTLSTPSTRNLIIRLIDAVK